MLKIKLLPLILGLTLFQSISSVFSRELTCYVEQTVAMDFVDDPASTYSFIDTTKIDPTKWKQWPKFLVNTDTGEMKDIVDSKRYIIRKHEKISDETVKIIKTTQLDGKDNYYILYLNDTARIISIERTDHDGINYKFSYPGFVEFGPCVRTVN